MLSFPHESHIGPDRSGVAVASVGKRCKHADKSRCRCNWVVRYRDAQGRQREESYLWDQKTLANGRKAKVEHDLRAGQPVFSRRVASASAERLDDFAETWLSQHTGSVNTLVNYRSCYSKHISPALGSKPLAAITREEVRKLLLTTMPETVGTSMLITARMILTSMFGEAVLQGKMPGNPASRVRLPNGPSMRAEFTFATHEQLLIVEQAIKPEWRVALWLMRGCGLRLGEALAVKDTCVMGDILRIEEQVLGRGGLGPLKHRKPGEYRDVPLPTYLAERVRAHISKYGKGYLIPACALGRTPSNTWRLAFVAGAKQAGLPRSFTPHDLRHTFVSIALSRGVPITNVSMWLGHRNINLTYRVYGHLVPNAASQARTVLDSEYQEWSTDHRTEASGH